MKNFLVLLFASLLIIGCSTKKDQPVKTADKFAFDTTSIKTVPVDNPSKSVLLEYKFEKGKTYKYRLTTITSSKQIIKADTTLIQDVTQKLTYITKLKPVDVDKKGVMEIEFTFTNIKLDAEANGRKFLYESGVTKDSTEILKYADYESMVENPFTARINKKGELLELFRTDRMLTKLLDMQGYGDSLNTAQKKELKSNLEEGVLKPLLFQIFRKIPSHNVAKDSTWEFILPSSKFMVFLIQNTNTYKFNSLTKSGKDEIAFLTDGMKTKISGKNTFTEKGVTYKFNQPKTDANGKIYFNLTKGCIQKAKRNTKLSLFFTMNADTPTLKQKGSKDTKIENTYIVELL